MSSFMSDTMSDTTLKPCQPACRPPTQLLINECARACDAFEEKMKVANEGFGESVAGLAKARAEMEVSYLNMMRAHDWDRFDTLLEEAKMAEMEAAHAKEKWKREVQRLQGEKDKLEQELEIKLFAVMKATSTHEKLRQEVELAEAAEAAARKEAKKATHTHEQEVASAEAAEAPIGKAAKKIKKDKMCV